jgi:hypothetical protein
MLTGELGVEYSHETRRGSSVLQSSHAMVLPTGVWHRFVWRQAGLLLALSPLQGTRLSRDPVSGGQTS